MAAGATGEAADELAEASQIKKPARSRRTVPVRILAEAPTNDACRYFWEIFKFCVKSQKRSLADHAAANRQQSHAEHGKKAQSTRFGNSSQELVGA